MISNLVVSKRFIYAVTGILLAIVGVLHLSRVIMGWSLKIQTYEVPMWLSVLAFLLLGFLSYHFWRYYME